MASLWNIFGQIATGASEEAIEEHGIGGVAARQLGVTGNQAMEDLTGDALFDRTEAERADARYAYAGVLGIQNRGISPRQADGVAREAVKNAGNLDVLGRVVEKFERDYGVGGEYFIEIHREGMERE